MEWRGHTPEILDDRGPSMGRRMMDGVAGGPNRFEWVRASRL